MTTVALTARTTPTAATMPAMPLRTRRRTAMTKAANASTPRTTVATWCTSRTHWDPSGWYSNHNHAPEAVSTAIAERGEHEQHPDRDSPRVALGHGGSVDLGRQAQGQVWGGRMGRLNGRCYGWSCDTVHIKFSATPDDAPEMNLRAGWTPRILGAVLVAFAAWFVVAHADGFLPAIGQVAGLGPAALPIGLAIVGGRRAQSGPPGPRFVPARGAAGALRRHAAPERDVLRHQQGGEVGGNRRSGALPGARRSRRRVPGTRQRRLPRRQARRDGLALLPDRSRGRRRRRDGWSARGRALGRGRVGGVRARRGDRARAHRRSTLAGRRHRRPDATRGVPVP